MLLSLPNWDKYCKVYKIIYLSLFVFTKSLMWAKERIQWWGVRENKVQLMVTLFTSPTLGQDIFCNIYISLKNCVVCTLIILKKYHII